MLHRIVRLSIRSDAIEQFLRTYHESAPRVRSFPGCHHLELWSDANHDGVYATFSIWADAAALEHYRASSEFGDIWTLLKPLFAAPARADSYLPAESAATDASSA